MVTLAINNIVYFARVAVLNGREDEYSVFPKTFQQSCSQAFGDDICCRMRNGGAFLHVFLGVDVAPIHGARLAGCFG